MATIELDQLTKRFGNVLAVDDVSFTVEQGSIVGFLGPNGAGKTTTLRMLLGLVTPTRGTATINGRPYRELPDPATCRRAPCSKPPAPTRAARPANHLRIEALAGQAPRHPGSTRSSTWSTSPEPPAGGSGSSPSACASGSGLATALLVRPRDPDPRRAGQRPRPRRRALAARLLRGLAAEGRTVLVSSHILAEVAQTVDSVVIMDHGRLVTQSTWTSSPAAAPSHPGPHPPSRAACRAPGRGTAQRHRRRRRTGWR